MGLPGDGEFTFEKPDLGNKNEQLEIIDELESLAWKLQTDDAQFDKVELVIDNKIHKAVRI